MISKASRLVSSHIFVQRVMLPPTRVWSDAPTRGKDIARAHDDAAHYAGFCVMRKFGSSNAVVAI